MQLPILATTTVDLDGNKTQTFEVSKTATTSSAILAGTVLVVSNVDVFVDIGPTPDCTTRYGLVPAGPAGVCFWPSNPDADYVSVRTVSAEKGWVSLYAV